ncbi:HEPN domain-containing protein [Aureimonas sp. AU4]|uniref:HEPN domain-containing protein n=1 Tax=Aureimonas sp. AU4 TaxID=1638163 RepID=UPI001FCCCFBC|nr:HEPN domain-containing protein [Aureimonas sp. AU4]
MTVRTVDVRDLTAATEEAVHEHIAKANEDLAAGEYADAILYCYNLVEQLLKAVLRERGVEFKASQGDIRTLYNMVASELGLNPGEDTIERPLRPILEGLQKLVSGILTGRMLVPSQASTSSPL